MEYLTSNLLKPILSDDKILEVAIAASEKRTLEAARLLRYYLIGAWDISLGSAVDIVKKLAQEFEEERVTSV